MTPTWPATVMGEGNSVAACPDAGQGFGQSVIVIPVAFVKEVAVTALGFTAALSKLSVEVSPFDDLPPRTTCAWTTGVDSPFAAVSTTFLPRLFCAITHGARDVKPNIN